ncbi:MAG: HAD-IA family hydrolase [Gemmatimonadota bacterium]|nr:HAD-IA family hydrolase [Gemmatimonadota bacterium]
MSESNTANSHSPPRNRPIAVLFDLDGTLIDSIGLLLASVRHAFEGFNGRAPTETEWVAGIGTPLGKQLRQFCESEQQLDAVTLRYRTFQRAAHDRLTSAFPGTLETLGSLAAAGHPMGIVTSKSNEMMHRALDLTRIAPYMTSAIGCDSCTIHKPEPFPVLMALQELGYDATEAVFVGDSPHDVNAGNAAGVVSVAALWGPFTREQLAPANPAHYLDDISALPALVQRIQNRAAV